MEPFDFQHLRRGGDPVSRICRGIRTLIYVQLVGGALTVSLLLALLTR